MVRRSRGFLVGSLLAAAVGCGEQADPPRPPGPEVGGSVAVRAAAVVEAALAGRFDQAVAAARPGSPLQQELQLGESRPPAWLAKAAGLDLAAEQRLAIDPLLELALIPGARGRNDESLVVVMRRAELTTAWQPAAVASVPALTLFDGLAPVDGDFPASTMRRLVLLLDGLLRAALTERRSDLAEFVSADAPPWGLRASWPPILAAPRDGRSVTASIATFTVRAQARSALLAAARIDRFETTDPSQVGAPVDATLTPPLRSECLILYRPLSPRVSGTAWGVAMIFVVGEARDE